MRGERSADPSRVHQCPQCARDCMATALGIAEHRAYHLEWARTNSKRPHHPRLELDTLTSLRDAWRGYASELEHLASDLRGQIAHLEDERRRLLEDVATRDDAIEDLTADYAHLLDEYKAAR